MSFDPNDPKIPILGKKPMPDPRMMKPIERDIESFNIQDEKGIAQFQPQADMTGLESSRITQMFISFLFPAPVPIKWSWRKFIAEHKLDRHFVMATQATLMDAAKGKQS